MDKRFTAQLEMSPAKGGWTYLVWKAIGKQAGDTVTVHLEERLTD